MKKCPYCGSAHVSGMHDPLCSHYQGVDFTEIQILSVNVDLASNAVSMIAEAVAQEPIDIGQDSAMAYGLES